MARLRMTNADYLAIAVSPALIMALIGSLVFFLIEVLYVGEYHFRLNYVFALFVFATVLIARIGIEMGSERAAMFSLPLGLVTFLALMRFVEHQTALSPVINGGLLALVWWCSHKLTWDCTVIDDNDDASGEGLLDKLDPPPLKGWEQPSTGDPKSPERRAVVSREAMRGGIPSARDISAIADNELFAADKTDAEHRWWWQRVTQGRQGPHSPGLWVLYFSLAALPLFGALQRMIPTADVASRRYAFGLLAVYVFAGLSLLVTTSFLGLRRYLRQRHVEMPAPMAGAWVTLGGVLILLVMFVAALIPRPAAEYAISRVPWQASSPGNLRSSDVSIGKEGADEHDPEKGVVSDDAEAPPGSAVDDQQHEQSSSQSSDEGQGNLSASDEGKGQQGQGESSSSPGESSHQQESPPNGEQGEEPSPSADQSSTSGANREQSADNAPQKPGEPTQSESNGPLEKLQQFNPAQLMQGLTSSLGNMLKMACYALGALLLAYLAWRYREEIMRALADVILGLRDFWSRLFGGQSSAAAIDDGPAAAARRRTFADFRDPFAAGRSQQASPVELVRYTFEAFEAWASDRGCPRTPDRTPHELVRQALPPQTPMYDEARRMAQLYSEAAYASGAVSRSAASSLQRLWQMMRSSGTNANN